MNTGVIVGVPVGTTVGSEVEGATVGSEVVGSEVEGASVGAEVGSEVKGASVGAGVGSEVAGLSVGSEVAGEGVNGTQTPSIEHEPESCSDVEHTVPGASIDKRHEFEKHRPVRQAGALQWDWSTWSLHVS